MKNTAMPYLYIFAFGIVAIFFMSFIGLNNMEEISAEKEGGGEATEEVAASPEEIYNKSCIACHGDQYQGGVGPALTGLTKSPEELKAILVDGTPNGMPGGLIPGQEDAVAEWLTTLK
ncbi:cytochrome c550 [Cytobacillus eiseniae]|uniref:Cytochrome c550 n=1 Tax=Cytobacillus eiseniae TaxID=762947 RepID=A0ABS4RFH2_9BACI|nr:cytochrome c [Cytobacillus eiseniae]MBP2241653.1 cytochrome c550 [Cytobacillus eiseniae]